MVAVLGITGVVVVFVAMLSMAKGFQLTLVESGSPGNAMVRRGGANSEMESAVMLDQIRIISDAPGIARSPDRQSLVSPEVVVIASFPTRSTGANANVQIRGVSEKALMVHDTAKIAVGRFFRPGLAELVLGRNAAKMYRGFDLGATPRFGGREWTVVGIMDAGGSAFDSEIWCDATVLNQAYKRPESVYQSVAVRLTSPSALASFQQALISDPRLTIQVERETDYYARQSRAVSTMIRVLGFLVASIMGIGAVFGALNTMYSAVAARTREIATMRAIGFSGASVVLSWLVESLFIALLGGGLGCLAVLPLNGYTTSTINWQTFSHLAFAFRVTPDLLAKGIGFALLMGLLGGVLPALRAARMPVATALRAL
jgi:putative ABC transport system permease protein